MFGIIAARIKPIRLGRAVALSVMGIGLALVIAITVAPRLTTSERRVVFHSLYAVNSWNDEASSPYLAVGLPRANRALMALDTGCGQTVISEVLAAQLSLKPEAAHEDDNISPILGAGSTFVTVPFLRLGPVVVKSLRCRIVPRRTLERVDRVATDGILGADFLRHIAMELDSNESQITLWCPGGLPERELMAAGFSAGDSVPVKLQPEDGEFRVRCTLGGRSVEATIDTGASDSTVTDSAAKKLGLKAGKGSRRLRTLYGEFHTHDFVAPALGLGRSRLTGLTLGLLPSSVTDWSHGLNLGMDTLRKFHLLLDFESGQAYFKRTKNTGLPPAPPLTSKLPMAILGNRQAAVVVGILSDGQAHLFGVDLGRTQTTILADAATRAHLKIEGAGQNRHCVSSFESRCTDRVPRVSMQVVTSDSEVQGFPQLEGCLGSDFFEHLKLDVSPMPGEMMFVDQSFQDDFLKPGPGPVQIRWTRIPLVERSGRWYVTGQIDGKPCCLRLDSLATRTIVYRSPAGGTASSDTSGPIGRTRPADRRGLWLAGIKQGDPLIETFPMGKPRPDNILGLDDPVLPNPITIDYGRRAMYIGVFMPDDKMESPPKSHSSVPGNTLTRK